MIKSYEGYSIPDCVDNPHYRGTLLDNAKFANECVAWRVGIQAECGAIRCSDCILRMDMRDRAARLKRLREYVKANPIASPSEPMPELRPGMLLRDDEGSFLLYLSPLVSLAVHRCESSVPGITTRMWVCTPDAERILEVWWATGSDAALSPGDASLIIEGKTADLGVINSWKRPNPVREMTVDEISEALGYKVKVIGSNEKVDD